MTTLRSLDVSNSDLTDDSLSAIIHRLPNLRVLNSSQMKQLTAGFIRHLGEGALSNLEEWNFSMNRAAGDQFLTAIQHCPKLRVLNITANLVRIQHNTYAHTHTRARTSLRRLTLVQVTDSGIQALAAHCPGLEAINMSNCPQISDASLAAIALSCPNLHSIQLRMCKKVTDVGVRGA